MKTTSFLMALGSVLILTGCVDRGTADQKLVNACKAGIEAFLYDGQSIQTVKKQTITNDIRLGSGFRKVVLDLNISDGYHGQEGAHTCIFLEEFGFAKMSYRASIYQLNSNGRTIGQQGYEIQGSLQEMTKLTDAVDKVLSQ